MTRLHAHDAGVAAHGYVLPVPAHTPGGNENLSRAAPKEIAEIKSVMSVAVAADVANAAVTANAADAAGAAA
ncbi:MAG: hypothetical protein OD918_11745 [Gammaproteobacteria bacterium]